MRVLGIDPQAPAVAFDLGQNRSRRDGGHFGVALHDGLGAHIEHGQAVIVVVPSPTHSEELHAKVVSNIQEIRARGAKVIAIAEEGDSQVAAYAEHVVHVPQSIPVLAAILTVIPLQVFALSLATALGRDVDQPRNLAKSVTVE